MDAHFRGLPSEPDRSIFRPTPRFCRLPGGCDVRAAAKGHVRGSISPFEAAESASPSGRLTCLPNCEEQGVQSALLPPRIIEKGLASEVWAMATASSRLSTARRK